MKEMKKRWATPHRADAEFVSWNSIFMIWFICNRYLEQRWLFSEILGLVIWNKMSNVSDYRPDDGGNKRSWNDSFCQAVRRNIPEGCLLHTCRRENLKSHRDSKWFYIEQCWSPRACSLEFSPYFLKGFLNDYICRNKFALVEELNSENHSLFSKHQ